MNLPINQIICGNNVDVVSTFPDSCIDLTVTSPPYDNLRTYGGHSWDFKGLAHQLLRITKVGGVVVWVVADATVNGSETGTSFKQALYFKKIGFLLHDTMIWHKKNPLPLNSNRYEPSFEYMFVLSKETKPRCWNPQLIKSQSSGKPITGIQIKKDGTKVPKHGNGRTCNDFVVPHNIWEYSVGAKGDSNHPAVFPEELARDHILSWSNEGDLVLDCFGGSGTTPKMAESLDRKWIVIEINPDYIEIIKTKITKAEKYCSNN